MGLRHGFASPGDKDDMLHEIPKDRLTTVGLSPNFPIKTILVVFNGTYRPERPENAPMIRLSKLADYGMVLMGRMACDPRHSHSAIELAADTHLPLPTVSKMLTVLARAELLVSQRGAKGGYVLARDPERISVADVVRAVDGPVALTQCIEHGPGSCGLETLCPARGGWHRINLAIERALAGVSLAEMAVQRPIGVARPRAEQGAPPLLSG